MRRDCNLVKPVRQQRLSLRCEGKAIGFFGHGAGDRAPFPRDHDVAAQHGLIVHGPISVEEGYDDSVHLLEECTVFRVRAHQFRRRRVRDVLQGERKGVVVFVRLIQDLCLVRGQEDRVSSGRSGPEATEVDGGAAFQGSCHRLTPDALAVYPKVHLKTAEHRGRAVIRHRGCNGHLGAGHDARGRAQDDG